MRILVVEDSTTTRRLIVKSLQAIGLSDCLEAEDGVIALTKLKEEHIDIVITDWNMPNMDGLELVANMRSDNNLKKIPVVMLTTMGKKENILAAAKNKVNGYLVKPLNKRALAKTLIPIVKKINAR